MKLSDCPVKVARKVKKLTQTELAKAVGCTNTAIANIERGARLPSLRLVLHLAPVLDMSFAALAAESVAYFDSCLEARIESSHRLIQQTKGFLHEE